MFFFYFKVCAYQKYKLPPRADETIVFCMQNTRLDSLKKNRAARRRGTPRPALSRYSIRSYCIILPAALQERPSAQCG